MTGLTQSILKVKLNVSNKTFLLRVRNCQTIKNMNQYLQGVHIKHKNIDRLKVKGQKNNIPCKHSA